MALFGQFEALWYPLMAIPGPGKGPAHHPSFATLDPTTLFHQFEAATPAFSHKMTIYGLFRPFWGPMAPPHGHSGPGKGSSHIVPDVPGLDPTLIHAVPPFRSRQARL